MAADRQEVRKIPEAASLEQVQEWLLALAAEPVDSEVDIRVLYPSGEVALDDQLPGRTSVGALLEKLSAGSEGTPGRLSLLRGTEVLQRDSMLKQLNLTDHDCLYLVRRSVGTYTEWTPPPMGTPGARCDHVVKVKCMMLGGVGAGKTSLVRAFSRQPFQDMSPPTIGIDFKSVSLRSEDGLKLKVQLWDTPGHVHSFRRFTRSQLRFANGFLAVFSLCSRASWVQLLQLLQDAQDSHPEACCHCLVGTHADIPGREVSEQEVLELAASKKCQHFEVSCKLGHDVDAPLFAWLDAFLKARVG